MAENKQQQEEPEFLSAYYPDPPPFYKHFTRENQERLQQFKSDDGITDDGAGSGGLPAAQLLSLPPELRCLVPPEPPADDAEYHVFGEATTGRGVDAFDRDMEYIGRGLLDEGTIKNWIHEHLYPVPPADQNADGVQVQWTVDRQTYLLRFVRSILLNYLELLGILANNPASEDKDEKLRNILNLVTNAHALVNEYRPHQARETLINMMEDQLEKKKAEVEDVRQMKQKVEDVLAELARQGPDGAASAAQEENAAQSAEEKRKHVQRDTWHVLDELLGH
ncbi:mediator of RNA polymerase II transcription subunit 7 [Lophiostoma macrostomum CBS 122681]|uniref:Mediator of RNA polymerase II transcription subunit 7 n=1 Tax=Lophiostoma macrostomum CBS 122681 TaxID=1314788 RepID=A0A6A6SX27_9PLEO|nr:mediator of RNA polymerase II transcription subunit 7 [Lophiostoma macrostomum CBS 122681]